MAGINLSNGQRNVPAPTASGRSAGRMAGSAFKKPASPSIDPAKYRQEWGEKPQQFDAPSWQRSSAEGDRIFQRNIAVGQQLRNEANSTQLSNSFIKSQQDQLTSLQQHQREKELKSPTSGQSVGFQSSSPITSTANPYQEDYLWGKKKTEDDEYYRVTANNRNIDMMNRQGSQQEQSKQADYNRNFQLEEMRNANQMAMADKQGKLQLQLADKNAQAQIFSGMISGLNPGNHRYW